MDHPHSNQTKNLYVNSNLPFNQIRSHYLISHKNDKNVDENIKTVSEIEQEAVFKSQEKVEKVAGFQEECIEKIKERKSKEIKEKEEMHERMVIFIINVKREEKYKEC